ncbi:MAG: sigma factor-like helix-turn-helix DNA-binding protein [Planctomycetota bacterium]
MQAALERLAPDLRAVLLLRHTCRLPYAELTQRLALSERTIHNRLRSAAVAFARQLRQLDAQEDL